jgi:hypothetical protein
MALPQIAAVAGKQIGKAVLGGSRMQKMGKIQSFISDYKGAHKVKKINPITQTTDGEKVVKIKEPENASSEDLKETEEKREKAEKGIDPNENKLTNPPKPDLGKGKGEGLIDKLPEPKDITKSVSALKKAGGISLLLVVVLLLLATLDRVTTKNGASTTRLSLAWNSLIGNASLGGGGSSSSGGLPQTQEEMEDWLDHNKPGNDIPEMAYYQPPTSGLDFGSGMRV